MSRWVQGGRVKVNVAFEIRVVRWRGLGAPSTCAVYPIFGGLARGNSLWALGRRAGAVWRAGDGGDGALRTAHSVGCGGLAQACVHTTLRAQ